MAANEFVHADPGSVLTQNEYIASPGSSGGHTLGTNQAVGDLIYASSAGASGIIRRLAIGTSGQYLTVAGGIPAWSSTLTGTVITATTNFTMGSTVITDDVITFTPTASDTVTMTAAANGAFSLVTVDAAGVAANIQITADGTVDIDSAGVLTLDSGAAINIEPAADSAILLDGTISIDAGVVTGATSITSTVFVGGLTGNVTGNASGTAATVTTAAQSNITSLGTLTTLTVDSIIINGTNIGHTSDTDAIAISSGGVVTMNQIPVFSAGINVSGGTIAGTLATAAQANVTSLGTLTALTVSGLITANGGITFADGDDIAFTGATGTNDIVLVNGLADALSITDGSGDVLTVNTAGGTNTVAITGNLTVSGTTTTVDTTTLAVEDSLISLATGNDSTDALDIGLYGLYDTSGSQDEYSGLFRDATDEKWKLFQDLQVAPVGTVNTAGAGYAVGTLVANLEGNATTVTTNANLTGHIVSTGNATLLGTDSFTSAHLSGALTNETGSGVAVFNTSPTLITPALGTPASGVMTNMTGAVTASIVDNAITLAKMAGLARGKIIYGDASGNPAALASGSAGQVLKMTDGNDFAWATAAGTTQTFEADGDIATGDFVSLNSDGTVSKSVAPVTSPVDFESAATLYNAICYDVDTNRVVIAYIDDANSDYGTAIVGTVSGGAITFGTPVVFESAACYYMAASYDEVVDKVVISYRDNGNSLYGTSRVGTVSGTAISFPAAAAVWESASVSYVTSVFAPDGNDPSSDTAADGRVVIAYRDNGNSNYGTAVVAEAAADNTIAFGTPVVFESATVGMSEMDCIAYDPDTNRVVIAYDDDGNSSHGTAVVGEISDADANEIDFGTPVVFEAASTSFASVAYDTNANKMVISYRDGGDGNASKGIVGTVTGSDTNAIAFNGSAATYETHGSSYFPNITFDPSENKLMVLWEDYDSSITNAGTYKLGTVSGDAISWGDAIVMNYAVTSYMSPVYDPDSQLMVVAFQDGGDSNHGKCVLIDSGADNNFLDWVGIAGTGEDDGEDIKVNLLGTINENQSSLTIGAKYYMQNNGTVTTNSIANRQVGMATASTKMFITAGSIS